MRPHDFPVLVAVIAGLGFATSGCLAARVLHTDTMPSDEALLAQTEPTLDETMVLAASAPVEESPPRPPRPRLDHTVTLGHLFYGTPAHVDDGDTRAEPAHGSSDGRAPVVGYGYGRHGRYRGARARRRWTPTSPRTSSPWGGPVWSGPDSTGTTAGRSWSTPSSLSGTTSWGGSSGSSAGRSW